MAKAEKAKPVPITVLRLDFTQTIVKAERDRIKEINRIALDMVAARLRRGPIEALIVRKKIGPEEFQAAVEINEAFMALSGGLMFKPQSLERRDPSYQHDWPVKTADLVRRHQSFADHWSMRKKQGDPSLEILIAAVVDERSFSTIEDDIGIRNGTASKVTARLLRDYAARAGWVDNRTAAKWKAEAGDTFKPSSLIGAIGRALAVKLKPAMAEST